MFQNLLYYESYKAYRHDVPVAHPDPFINSATGEDMEWFAVNDYDDYYYYEAYYYEFYENTELDKDGICSGYPGIKFNQETHDIQEYVDAEGCFVPNSHCTVENTHSTLCITDPSRLSAGYALDVDTLDCVDRKSGNIPRKAITYFVI